MININKLSFAVLTIFLSRAFFNGIGYSYILSTGKNISIISILIGFILGLLYIKIYKKNTKNNTFNFIYIVISIIILFNDFVNFSSIKYLVETPNIMVALIYILPLLYITNKGKNTIFISGQFLFFISIMIFVTNSVTLLKEVDINNLKPLLANDLFNVLKGSLIFFIYSISPIIILSTLNKDNKYDKSITIGYIISTISILIITFYITTIYDYNYTNLFNYPVYFVLKKIKYNFISNAENIVSYFFIIDYFYSLLIYIYLIYDYLKKYFKNKTKIILVILITILTYISIIKIENVVLNKNANNIYIVLSIIYIIYNLIKKNKS